MNDSSKSTSPSGDHMAATAFERSQPEARGAGGDGGSGVSMSYVKFGAMILTSGVAMFILMYVNSYQLSHAKWSETRFYMTFVMIAVMAFRTFAGQFSSRYPDGWSAAALYWHTTVGVFVLVWYAVYITK